MFTASASEALATSALGLSVLIADMTLLVSCTVTSLTKHAKSEDGAVCHGRSYYLIKRLAEFGVL